MKIGSMLAGVTLAVAAAMPASAHEVQYSAVLSGANEFPANGSPGLGTALVTVDLDLYTMRVQFSFSGLVGNATAAHIHCCIPAAPANPLAGVATETPSFVGFPVNGTVHAATYDHTYDLLARSTYNPSNAANQFFQLFGGGTVAGAMNALIIGMDTGKAYLNVHSSTVPGGEIRGFLQPVPEPETYAMMLAGLGLVGFAAARRRKVAA